MNRLANMSKPEHVDSSDTDVCACESEGPLSVSDYRKGAVKGPQQFEQVAHYNARSASFAL